MPVHQPRLRDALRRTGLSVPGAAAAAGMSAPHLFELLHGKREASDADGVRLAPVLGLEPQEVLALCDPRPPAPTPAKMACVAARLTSSEIAAELGLADGNTVSRALNGRRTPSLRLVAYLVERLQLPVELLFPGLDGGAEPIDAALVGGGE